MANEKDKNKVIVTELIKRNSTRSFATLFAQVSAIVLAIVAANIVNEVWATCVSILFIGTRQYGLGEVLVHEASHCNLSENIRTNNIIGTLLSWPFFFTFAGYRRFHVQHHSVPLDNPENSIYEQYRDWSLPLNSEEISRFRMFWLLVLRPLIGVTAVQHLYVTLTDIYYDSDLTENTILWFLWTVVLFTFWNFDVLTPFLIYWFIPYIYVFATLNYWSEISDHYRTSEFQTRTYSGGFWNTMIAGNIGYHAVHHKYPGIPWFRLKQAHSLLGQTVGGQTCDGPVSAINQLRSGKTLTKISGLPA